MSWHSLPLFVWLGGRPVILVGDGEAADAKRRLLERAGAVVVGEDGFSHPHPSHSPGGERAPSLSQREREGGGDSRRKGEGEPRLAIVALDDEAEAHAAVARLRTRGILVNAVDRPELCDFTLPAIVDRDPVLVAIGTGGVSAGLAAALRQRLEALLPAELGRLAEALSAARGALREALPDVGGRRRAIAAALAPGAALDPLYSREGGDPDRAPAFAGSHVVRAIAAAQAPARTEHIFLTSADPDDLTLRQARWLANADRVLHRPDVPPAILDRARADAPRIAVAGEWPQDAGDGLTVRVEAVP